MPIVLKEKGGQGSNVPPGTHLAICYRIVDMGTQPDSGFGEKQKLSISWELPNERVNVDGKDMPMGISKTYTKSLNKKAVLRQDLAAWRGRDFTAEELEGFKLGAILGKPCLVTVELNENGKARVSGVTSIMKGMTVPPIVNALVEYSVDDGRNETFRNLPEWLRKACESCIEWQPKPAKTSAEEPTKVSKPVEAVVEDVPF